MLCSVPAHGIHFGLCWSPCCVRGSVSTHLPLCQDVNPTPVLHGWSWACLVMEQEVSSFEGSWPGKGLPVSEEWIDLKHLRNFPFVFIISWMLVIFPGTVWALPVWDLWSSFAFAAMLTISGLHCSYFCPAEPRARGTGCVRFINKYLLFWVMTEGEGISWLWMTG